jgi:hypothetical protein
MKAMLNDPSYEVSVYNKTGCIGVYNPSKELRKMMSGIISNTTGVQTNEAKRLMDNYEFSTNDAKTMISFSKEYINSYMHTGRKLPLGGREKMGVSLSLKEVPTQQKKLPANGIAGAKGDTTIIIPEHETIKVSGGCPVWQRTGK